MLLYNTHTPFDNHACYFPPSCCIAWSLKSLNCFDDGAVVDTEALLKSGLIKKTLDGIKVLADGELTKKLTVKANAFSAAAKEKIEAAGGKAEVI